MIKKALSSYRSSSRSVQTSSSSINGKTKGAVKASGTETKDGKGVKVLLEDTTETDPVLSIEKVASHDRLHMFCHVDATDWCPHSSVIDKLSKFFTKDVCIKIYPRYMVGKVWSECHGGKPYTKEYYAFRAFAGPDYCKIFVDETETKDSVLWVMLHELAHIALASAPFLFKAYRHLTPPDYFESDEAHEKDPEEQMANAMAMSWMDLLGYGKVNYPRHWWRNRTLMNSNAAAYDILPKYLDEEGSTKEASRLLKTYTTLLRGTKC